MAVYSGTAASRNPAARPVLNAFMDGIGSPMRFDSNTIDQPGKAVAQAMLGMWGAPPQGFEGSDVCLLIGVNPFVSVAGGVPMSDPVRSVREARAKGMRLLVIDPRRSETAAAADQHLQPVPGEDIALVASLLHVILRDGLHDTGFCADHVAGVDALRAAVAPFAPEAVAARADVRPDEIEALARTFATAGRGVATSGTGPSLQGRGSTLLEYLVMVLNTVCGRWLRAGEPLWNPGVLMPTLGHRAQATPPWTAYGYGEPLRVRGLADAACGLSTAALADEILLEGDGRVRALICLGGNPVAAWPDQPRTWAAMQALDLLVTFDIKMSATARAADYVIAPRLTLEVAGTTWVTEVVYHYAVGFGLPRPWAQYAPAIVEPPPGSDVIEEWRFVHGVARRMGVPLALQPQFPRPDGPVRRLDDEDPAGVDLTDLMAFLYANGRVPLAEVRRHERGAIFDDGPPVVVEPAEPGWTGRLDVANAELLSELATATVPWWPSDPAFPFRLVCRRHVGALNSAGRDLPRMQGRPWNPAYLHPDDLSAIGVAPGGTVEIRSPHGAIPAVVEADATLRRGLVSMAHSYGDVPGTEDRFREVGSNTSQLTRVDVDHDRITGMPRMSNVPVAVTPIPSPSPIPDPDPNP